MAVNRPVQVFTDMKQLQRTAKSFLLTSENAHNLQAMNGKDSTQSERQINVTGVGEMELPPDRFSITIKCRSVKESVSDAKASVTRRLDYIVQALKNAALKEEDFCVYQMASHQDSAAVYECEVEAHFIDVSKCLALSNLLVEKLGPGISVSLPVCYHSTGSLDRLRKQVGMLAIHNARHKATEMAKVVNMVVGPALQVNEESFTEGQGSKVTEETGDLTPGVRQRMADNAVRMTSQVSVTFCLRPNRKKVKQDN